MAIRHWFLSCIPGLSILLLFLLVEISLGIGRSTYLYLRHKEAQPPVFEPVATQILFSIYSLALHVLAAAFPIRLARAARAATNAIRAYHSRDVVPLSEEEQRTTMVIILPAYKETITTLRETLDVLASHIDAATTYDLFLAMEERDPDALPIAKQLNIEYSSRFLDIQPTFHPFGLPGESAGKSSNVSWAAQEVMAKYNGNTDVIVTVMDSDSHIQQQYFRYILSRHRIHQSSLSSNLTLYVPPIIFDRNAHEVPVLVRTADLMWSGAGLSCFSNTSPDRTNPSTHLAIPTSVYSLSLPLVQLTNGWDADASAIGEDMHMMLKCYFACSSLAHTPLHIENIPSPVSQCNIATPHVGIRGYLSHYSARYKQALRHMWGCLDSGYAVQHLISSSSASAASNSPSSYDSIKGQSSPQTSFFRNINLSLRLFEAHILPAHLPLILLATTLYTSLPRPTNEWLWLPHFLALCGYMRLVGFIAMVLYFGFVYEEYHRVCIEVREEEMRRAGLEESVAFSWRAGRLRSADGRIGKVGGGAGARGKARATMGMRECGLHWVKRACGWIDYLVFPVAGTVYGAVPLCQAAVSHFWGRELVYRVSAKPVRAGAGGAGAGRGGGRGGIRGLAVVEREGVDLV